MLFSLSVGRNLSRESLFSNLAITDHDTISGVNEAQRTGDAELSCLCEKLRAGLYAIECYYPKYTQEQQAFYLRLAEKHKLHQTGGSDFHGEKVKPDIRLTDT